MKRILALASLVLLLPGCCTTPTTFTYRTQATLITSVDTAMMGWADWVRLGQATPAQVEAVKGAYQKYYASQIVASNALALFIAAGSPEASNRVVEATVAAGASAAAVAALIETFKRKATP